MIEYSGPALPEWVSQHKRGLYRWRCRDLPQYPMILELICGAKPMNHNKDDKQMYL